MLVALLVGALLIQNPIDCKSAEKTSYDYQVDVPDYLEEITEHIGNYYGVSKYILQAMAFTESSFIKEAENKSCKGLFQVSVKWHKKRIEKFGFTTDDIFFPYLNCLVATDYLMEIAKENGEDGELCDISLALDIYNGNSKAFYNYEHGILSSYAKKVLTIAQTLEEQDELQQFK